MVLDVWLAAGREEGELQHIGDLALEGLQMVDAVISAILERQIIVKHV